MTTTTATQCGACGAFAAQLATHTDEDPAPLRLGGLTPVWVRGPVGVAALWFILYRLAWYWLSYRHTCDKIRNECWCHGCDKYPWDTNCACALGRFSNTPMLHQCSEVSEEWRQEAHQPAQFSQHHIWFHFHPSALLTLAPCYLSIVQFSLAHFLIALIKHFSGKLINSSNVSQRQQNIIGSGLGLESGTGHGHGHGNFIWPHEQSPECGPLWQLDCSVVALHFHFSSSSSSPHFTIHSRVL